ncbi:MAG: protein phosphatase CheZ [Betaproteobacteria bacterium]|nr:protein phosphatase CheZ [Betaproteobacteria bacterium]
MSAVIDNSTEDLEALFDQIAEQRDSSEKAASASTPASLSAPATLKSEAAAVNAAAAAKAETDPVTGEPYDIFQRVGMLTRNLHDALRELGYDKGIDSAVGALPDARARLTYIANLTGQAAEKALTMAEQGADIQSKIESEAGTLTKGWDDLFAGRQTIEQFKDTATRTHEFLRSLPKRTSDSGALFTDIMLAQDFHDLTGQVVNKIASIAQNIEDQLVKLLIDATPPEKREDVESSWLNGPVIDTKRNDVVTDQGQVDDLLASLGF